MTRSSDAAVQRRIDAYAEQYPDLAEVLRDVAAGLLRRIGDDQLAASNPDDVANWMFGISQHLTSSDPMSSALVVTDRTQPGAALPNFVIDVVTPDRAFLRSTLIDELHRNGLLITASWHAILGIELQPSTTPPVRIVAARTARHRLFVFRTAVTGDVETSIGDTLHQRLTTILNDVIRATDDFSAMRDRLNEVATELRFGSWTFAEPQESAEVADLLDWLVDDNFVLLGLRDYELAVSADGNRVEVTSSDGFGLFRDDTPPRSTTSRTTGEEPAARTLLTFHRTERVSTVQRRERMLDFGLLRADEDGRPVGELRIVGLFTRKALAEPVTATPVLRAKLAAILEREDVVDGSHDAITLTSLFQALPKDELFHATVDQLHTLMRRLADLEDHGGVHTLVRKDPESALVSVVVSIPRDRYNTQLRETLQNHLQHRYDADAIDADVSLGNRPDALVRFLIHTDTYTADSAEIRTEIADLTRTWFDILVSQIHANTADVDRQQRQLRIAERLPVGYRDVTTVDAAADDVALLDRLFGVDDDVMLTFRKPSDQADGSTTGNVRLRLAKQGDAVELSAFMPVLESVGLTVIEEIPHRLVDAPDRPAAHVHDFGVRANLDIERDGPRVADAIIAAWRGHLAVDYLNALVLAAGITWRDVAILRAYRRLRRQLGTNFSSEYVNQTLVGNRVVVRAIVDYFHAKFDPAIAASADGISLARAAALTACDELRRLDHDRILRGLVELIDATVRTNAFRTDAVADSTGEPYVAFKLDPSAIAGVAKPVPYREIFVHSPRVEGIHLRFGPVARGGLRWSDRRDDVRAEVFDLVKAQVLKNVVIVPTGAKGGFVVTNEPDDPAELRAEVQRQYQTFVRGMLDVTDNVTTDGIVASQHVIRHDGDDPYLVVAADKGTAAFSDTANELARRYNFWLDDAFASGGSNGYDHKALGVTARGAWLTIRRHFRELGIDVQTEPINVVGVGDMSGDVFGNAMLASDAIRLVAAFDHRDIFLDPAPDPSVSAAERRRLFELPRSSWQDYDRNLISRGGGVYSRDARTIRLSDEVRELLRIDATELSPPELIRAIVVAPVDLLFAGGIGTYVKASTQRNDELGDRANDELRVDASRVRARVIGEGANLFITQRGRIEYARRGGLINQDAIDNAGGVTTSDFEVNLKILLSLAQHAGRMSGNERDALLQDWADEVVDRVMSTVEQQAASVTRETVRSVNQLAAYDRMMSRLESTHSLDREIEVLPTLDELEARAQAEAGLTRPEAASLLAWGKREYKELLLASDVVDSSLLAPTVHALFPQSAIDAFGDLLVDHRLRRELVATAVANDVVDRLGCTFVGELCGAYGVTAGHVALAYRLVADTLGLDHLWELIRQMEQQQEPTRIRELEQTIEDTLRAVCAGFVVHPDLLSRTDRLAAQVAKVAATLQDDLLELGTGEQREARHAHLRWLVDDLVEPELARFLAVARDLTLLPEVADVVASDGRHTPTVVMEVFLQLGSELGLDRLENLLQRYQPDEPWSLRQRDGIASELRQVRRDGAIAALADDGDATAAVRTFLAARADQRSRVDAVFAQLSSPEHVTLDALAVAARTIRTFVAR
ncbi:MAG: NAD-glutamate dehydrogenase domain-containing protein [Nitriliruptoraceae bacterium]